MEQLRSPSQAGIRVAVEIQARQKARQAGIRLLLAGGACLLAAIVLDVQDYEGSDIWHAIELVGAQIEMFSLRNLQAFLFSSCDYGRCAFCVGHYRLGSVGRRRSRHSESLR
jgi:hypothetical protein